MAYNVAAAAHATERRLETAKVAAMAFLALMGFLILPLLLKIERNTRMIAMQRPGGKNIPGRDAFSASGAPESLVLPETTPIGLDGSPTASRRMNPRG